MTARFLLTVLVLGSIADPALAQGEAPSRGQEQTLLRRNYSEGERISYRMTASNRRPGRTSSYEATADGVVKQDTSGRFYEEYRWSRIATNGNEVSLPGDENAVPFVQLLSLWPGYAPSMPDLSRVHPALVGPVTDLLTFYADIWLAMQQSDLRRPGDRVLIAHKAPNSWADGTRTLLAQDAVDFDIAIAEVDESAGVVTILVRHVPPQQSAIQIPVDWMREPVADVPNNWIEVSRTDEGKYRARVGKETFDVEVKLSLVGGGIISARMDNPVEVVERACTDEALTQCGNASSYQIVRLVEMAQVQQ